MPSVLSVLSRVAQTAAVCIAAARIAAIPSELSCHTQASTCTAPPPPPPPRSHTTENLTHILTHVINFPTLTAPVRGARISCGTPLRSGGAGPGCGGGRDAAGLPSGGVHRELGAVRGGAVRYRAAQVGGQRGLGGPCGAGGAWGNKRGLGEDLGWWAWAGNSLPFSTAPHSPTHTHTHTTPQAAEGRACVIAVNKWDTVPVKTDKTLADYEADVRAQVGEERNAARLGAVYLPHPRPCGQAAAVASEVLTLLTTALPIAAPIMR